MNNKPGSIGRNITIINKHLKIFLKNKFRDIGLNHAEVMILLTISRCDGISQEGLIEHLGYDKAVITRRIKHLLESGYINRKRSDEDKRFYMLWLTEKGHELMPLIYKNLNELNDRITEGIPEETVDTIADNIELIAQNALKSLEKLNMEKINE